jgi:hypothetical protein
LIAPSIFLTFTSVILIALLFNIKCTVIHLYLQVVF